MKKPSHREETRRFKDKRVQRQQQGSGGEGEEVEEKKEE